MSFLIQSKIIDGIIINVILKQSYIRLATLLCKSSGKMWLVICYNYCSGAEILSFNLNSQQYIKHCLFSHSLIGKQLIFLMIQTDSVSAFLPLLWLFVQFIVSTFPQMPLVQPASLFYSTPPFSIDRGKQVRNLLTHFRSVLLAVGLEPPDVFTLPDHYSSIREPSLTEKH